MGQQCVCWYDSKHFNTQLHWDKVQAESTVSKKRAKGRRAVDTVTRPLANFGVSVRAIRRELPNHT
jgi:hypothetical protein